MRRLIYRQHGKWNAHEPLATLSAFLDRRVHAALVGDSNDHLHIAYREWGIKNGELHPYLSYRRKDPSDKTWSDVLMLVEAANDITGYGIWYLRMSRDRDDAIYLTFTFYQPDYDYVDKNDATHAYPRLRCRQFQGVCSNEYLRTTHSMRVTP